MGYSGSGITSDLRRVIEKEKLWDKHGINVKAIYFNSGSVMTQAIAGGNVATIVDRTGANIPEYVCHHGCDTQEEAVRQMDEFHDAFVRFCESIGPTTATESRDSGRNLN